MINNYKKLLTQELDSLNKAKEILLYSYKKCKSIGTKYNYSYEELDQYEAMTSRFARLSDIIIQKILRLIDIIDLEDEGTVRDRINRAEKKNLIKSADNFTEIRFLRNSIAHEYIMDALKEIFKSVIYFTPILTDSVDLILNYCNKNILMDK